MANYSARATTIHQFALMEMKTLAVSYEELNKCLNVINTNVPLYEEVRKRQFYLISTFAEARGFVRSNKNNRPYAAEAMQKMITLAQTLEEHLHLLEHEELQAEALQKINRMFPCPKAELGTLKSLFYQTHEGLVKEFPDICASIKLQVLQQMEEIVCNTSSPDPEEQFYFFFRNNEEAAKKRILSSLKQNPKAHFTWWLNQYYFIRENHFNEPLLEQEIVQQLKTYGITFFNLKEIYENNGILPDFLKLRLIELAPTLQDLLFLLDKLTHPELRNLILKKIREITKTNSIDKTWSRNP